MEFAIILPVFLLFFGAVLDLGRIAAARVSVTNAAREAAFQAAQTPTSYKPNQDCVAGQENENLVYCRTKLEARNSVVAIAPEDVTVSCSPSCTSGLGNSVTVAITGHFKLVTPFMAAFFGGNQDLTFTATSTHQIETLPVTANPMPTASPSPSPSPSSSASPSPSPSSLVCEIPSAGFTYSANKGSMKAPLQISFTDTSTTTSSGCGVTSWFWDFGPGRATSVSQTPPVQSYTVAGTYYVTLVVANQAGTATTGAVSITVKP